MTKHGSDEMVKSAENCHGADVAAKQRWASEAPSKKVFADRELKYLTVLPEAGKKGEDGERKVKVA